jgi:hypothetical protein
VTGRRKDSSKGHLRRAVDDYCKACTYDPLAGGTWRQQVTLCPSSECSLYPIRPVSQDAKHLLDAASGNHQSVKEALKAAARQIQASINE